MYLILSSLYGGTRGKRPDLLQKLHLDFKSSFGDFVEHFVDKFLSNNPIFPLENVILDLIFVIVPFFMGGVCVAVWERWEWKPCNLTFDLRMQTGSSVAEDDFGEGRDVLSGQERE